MISQKATILCVYEILKKYTDENHIISAEKIREKLKLIYDVDMERRAIYRNIDALRSMGIEIEGYIENREGYYLIDRTFEPSEIRLLCDAVAASDMIKAEHSKEIINKLIETQSVFQGRMLQKTIYVKEAEKSINKQIFYNIDTLNMAINQGCMVSAKQLHINYNLELAETGESGIVFSPYATLWADGNYYIIVKIEGEEELTHFRIDYLKDIRMLERNVDMVFGGINPNQYATKYILHKGENVLQFELECDTNVWDELVREFEKDIMVMHENSGRLRVKIRAIPSKVRQWVLSHINQCEVFGPKSFRDEIQKTVMDAYKKYWC